MEKNRNFYTKLIIAFIVTSIVPIILVIAFSYYNSSTIIKKNYDELTIVNLEQTKRSLDISLESYEDLLYQIYTDDEIVDLVGKINAADDIALARNQLRRILRGLFYTKEHLKSITIIPSNGDIIFYDQLTASNIENSWLENYSLSQQLLYDEIAADNATHLYTTRYASSFANKDYYLFHMGHRIINYKNVNAHYGVVLISIDEQLLKNICVSSEKDDPAEMISFNFIVDNSGYIVSYPDDFQISKRLFNPALSGKEMYEAFLEQNQVFGSANAVVNVSYDEKLRWEIINVANQSKSFKQLGLQQNILILTLLFSVSAIIMIIIVQAKNLTASIKRVVNVMNSTGKNVFTPRIEKSDDMPLEIQTIATNFNSMMERLEKSVYEAQQAIDKQRIAEIAALEAQINPHFLYNTLDSINWMAIEKDEYEISKAISALATILRYSVNNSNGIVTIKEETEWLEQYLVLQKTRLKNSFGSKISIEPQTLALKIHKLLLQPFVENAIMHGFIGTRRDYELVISITEAENNVAIDIIDNGCGMKPEHVAQINQGIFNKPNKNSIGIGNAIGRIHMYYGEIATVKVYSEWNKGTRVQIRIPLHALGTGEAQCE